MTGWWFGTWILLFHILGISSSQLTFIFFRGLETTNQMWRFPKMGFPNSWRVYNGTSYWNGIWKWEHDGNIMGILWDFIILINMMITHGISSYFHLRYDYWYMMGYGDIMEYIWMNFMVETWRTWPSIRQCVQIDCNGRYLYRKSSKNMNFHGLSSSSLDLQMVKGWEYYKLGVWFIEFYHASVVQWYTSWISWDDILDYFWQWLNDTRVQGPQKTHVGEQTSVKIQGLIKEAPDREGKERDFKWNCLLQRNITFLLAFSLGDYVNPM